MSWVRIDDGMPDSLKIAPLSDAAFRAYVTSICYAARSLSDGFIPMKKAKEIARRTRVIQELMPSLWENAEGGFMVHDYLNYNPTREQVLQERAEKHEAKVRAGQAGAAKRWQTDSRRHSKPIAEGIANGWQNDSPVPVPLPHIDKEQVVVEDVPLGRRNIFILYDHYMGKPSVTATMRGLLLQAEEDYAADCIGHCFEEAAKSSDGRRSWKYVEAILKRHETEGCVERKQVGRHANGAAQAGDHAASAAAVYAAIGIRNLPVFLPDGGAEATGVAALDGRDDSTRVEGER